MYLLNAKDYFNFLIIMKSSIIKILFLILIFYSNNSKSCDTCNTRISYVNNVIVKYEGVLYDFPAIGKSAWFYSIDNTNTNSSDISHLNFGTGLCITPSMFVGGGTYTSKTIEGLNYNNHFVLGEDLSDKIFKMYGIKYDNEISQGTKVYIFFVLNENLKVSSNMFKIKKGNQFYNGFICLPSYHCMPLPVELMNFSVGYVDGYPHLKWATALEVNNKGFEIQYSADKSEFDYIAFIESHHFSSEVRKYEYVDKKHSFGYYRLKVIDYDSHFKNSNIVFSEKKREVMLSPNPVLFDFEVSLGSYHILEAKIIDFQGKDISDKINYQKTETYWKINVQNLPKGIYTLILNKYVYTRFMKI